MHHLKSRFSITGEQIDSGSAVKFANFLLRQETNNRTNSLRLGLNDPFLDIDLV